VARRVRRSRPPPEERALLDELADVYRDADALYASHRCAGTTECCRFGLTGREPYVTSIELSAVRKAVAARGGPLAPRRRALPLAPAGDERTCPMLDAAARCSIYVSRPLGCRTFWCHRAEADQKVSQRALNDLVARIKAIAARHEPGGEVGRLLTRALRP
jgi:uncharacterized protein